FLPRHRGHRICVHLATLRGNVRRSNKEKIKMMRRLKSLRVLTTLGLSIFLNVTAFRADAETLREFLRDFHADPQLMMQRLPSEVDEAGRMRSRGFINEILVDAAIP